MLTTEKRKISEALNTSYPSLSNLKPYISGIWVVFDRKERQDGMLCCRKTARNSLAQPSGAIWYGASKDTGIMIAIRSFSCNDFLFLYYALRLKGEDVRYWVACALGDVSV